MRAQVDLGRNGIVLIADGTELTFDSNGSQFALGHAEVLDLFKWMQQNFKIERMVIEKLSVLPTTEIVVKANRSGPKIDLRDDINNIFKGR
ncbi:hypothetical protein SEA_NICEHOUSE_11 [Rhodococcus phage NiceHouse]|nr:hypothetical protein SEA_NICEHOUSE_11 [Rhodococcus phage NiceHouse]